MKTKYANLIVANAILFASAGTQAASDADLAQELTNPIANIITIPIQMNFDDGIGASDQGSKITTNIQPVIPFEVSDDWNLITRTIFPVISQSNIPPGGGSQFGLGDINMSLFFSPKKPTEAGLIWGVGPVFLLPTGTDPQLSARKWAAGPGVVALTIRGKWTLGFLGNHVWSFAGDTSRPDISNTFLQPFAAYTWPTAWTVSAQTETTYNWVTSQWSVPVHVAVSKLVKFGKLPVSLQAGIGSWVQSPNSGPEGMRYRLQANIVLPKKN
ncbi:MAG: hypothetical protein AMJ68_04910 [Acidithiobacillales bacterium SG8_45]|jgi:hypothetical protein|nr:MAG: hypothetical protein AMJ68_04910 [Acidithiobacillales bacterium SG8_45]